MNRILSFFTTFGSMWLSLHLSYLSALRLGMEKKFGYLVATVFPLLLCLLSFFALVFKVGVYQTKREQPFQQTMGYEDILDLWPGAFGFILFCWVAGFILIIIQNKIEDD